MRLLADKATAPFSAVDVTGNYRAMHQAWTSSIWGKPLVAVELIGCSKMLQETKLPASSLRQRQFLKTEVYLCTTYEYAAGETGETHSPETKHAAFMAVKVKYKV